MNKDGVLANSVTYNSLIDGYCKVGNMEKALEICSQMNENGVEPNVIIFSTLIDSYCKTGNMEAVVGFYSEMVIKGSGDEIDLGATHLVRPRSGLEELQEKIVTSMEGVLDSGGNSVVVFKENGQPRLSTKAATSGAKDLGFRLDHSSLKSWGE
ncbi:hypothetical protein J1N35_012890 [Gossypium stocksii]|uniref:Pentatricopeptide repeat-containing protein n=1 Tax=Gossypium stocksii TaxID=47602 RepID=A0A9D3VTR7_9ROSI|nr:hypothetical protein J1N35_012890 [Gossypium stocksii]